MLQIVIMFSETLQIFISVKQSTGLWKSVLHPIDFIYWADKKQKGAEKPYLFILLGSSLAELKYFEWYNQWEFENPAVKADPGNFSCRLGS